MENLTDGSLPAWKNSSSYGRLEWPFLSLAVIPVWMLCGNGLVLLTVLCNRRLRNLSNRVIASLAFTDLLLSILVVPFGIYQLVHGEWILGFYFCLVWTGSDVILSTTSIMHLCAIAIYRFHGIAYPLHLRSAPLRARVAALVVPAWTIAVALSVPFVVQGVLDRSNVLEALDLEEENRGGGGGGGERRKRMQCGLFNRTFAVYSSLVSFFLPLAVMIFADFRSIQILRANIKLPVKENKNGRVCYYDDDEGAESRHDDVTSNAISTVTSSTTLPTSFAASARGASSSHHVTNASFLGGLLETKGAPVEKTRRGFMVARRRARSKSMVYLSMLASGGSAKVNGRERRAEKTLLWVFAAFVALWLPFFCTNLAFGVCGEGCHIPGQLFQVFSWLGYLSSGVNPCIYTLLNRDFRVAFRNLLTCQRRKTQTGNNAMYGDATAINRHMHYGNHMH